MEHRRSGGRARGRPARGPRGGLRRGPARLGLPRGQHLEALQRRRRDAAGGGRQIEPRCASSGGTLAAESVSRHARSDAAATALPSQRLYSGGHDGRIPGRFRTQPGGDAGHGARLRAGHQAGREDALFQSRSQPGWAPRRAGEWAGVRGLSAGAPARPVGHEQLGVDAGQGAARPTGRLPHARRGRPPRLEATEGAGL